MAIGNYLQVHATGITQAATTSSGATVASIPNLANGNAPNYVRVAASAPAFIKFGGASVACTTNDIFIPGYTSEVFLVSGQTKFAVITSTGTASVNVVSLENG